MTKNQNQQPEESERPKKSPPMHIPLDFETAVEGLLGVDPKKPEKPVEGDDRGDKK